MNWNNTLLWVAIVILFFLVFRPIGKISNYEGSNSIFDLNELSWIPSVILKKFKDGVNDKIIPAMRDSALIIYDKIPESEKTKFINDIDIIFDNIAKKIREEPQKINITTGDSSTVKPS